MDGSSVENPEAHVATARALAQAGRVSAAPAVCEQKPSAGAETASLLVQYEQAISQYSLALAGDQPRPEEYVTLLERSTALLL